MMQINSREINDTGKSQEHASQKLGRLNNYIKMFMTMVTKNNLLSYNVTNIKHSSWLVAHFYIRTTHSEMARYSLV